MNVNKLTLGQYLRRFKGLRARHRDILHALASYGNYDLTGIKPAVETVARDYELRPNTVRDTMRELVAMGLLIKVRDGGGRNRPTEYRVATNTLSENDRVLDGKTLSKSDSVSGLNPVGFRSETLSESDGNPVGFRSETLSENDSQPVIDQFLPRTTTSAPAGGASSNVLFEDLFKAFPVQNTKDKPRAKAAYDVLVASGEVSAETLIYCARAYRHRCVEERTPEQFIRRLSNWLDRSTDPDKANWHHFVLVPDFTDWGDDRMVPRWQKLKSDAAALAAPRPEWL